MRDNEIMAWLNGVKVIVNDHYSPGERFLVISRKDLDDLNKLLTQNIASVDQDTIKEEVLKS